MLFKTEHAIGSCPFTIDITFVPQTESLETFKKHLN